MRGSPSPARRHNAPYLTLKLRALGWVLRRLRAGRADWLAGRRLLEMSEPMDTEIEIRRGSPEAE
jgi:hypothetical protein